MSATESAFATLKSVFTYREQMAALREDLKELGRSMSALAASHANLRDRVNHIEGYIKAATGQPFTRSDLPRIER